MEFFPLVDILYEGTKFSDSQIVGAVKRVEAGLGVPDICRELGISTATFYKYWAKCGDIDVSIMSRMKELEVGNWRLKKMSLEEKLRAEIVAEALEKVVRPSRRREMAKKAVTERGACFGLPARRFASANPTTATSASSMLKTTKWLIG